MVRREKLQSNEMGGEQCHRPIQGQRDRHPGLCVGLGLARHGAEGEQDHVRRSPREHEIDALLDPLAGSKVTAVDVARLAGFLTRRSAASDIKSPCVPTY